MLGFVEGFEYRDSITQRVVPLCPVEDFFSSPVAGSELGELSPNIL